MPRIIYAPDVFINPQDGSKLSARVQWGMHAVQFVWDTMFATARAAPSASTWASPT